MTQVTLYGAAYSVYVRIARLVLEEVGVPYELVEVDIYAEDEPPPGYPERHPFRKIPAFEHDGFRLYETDAIATYVVDAFGGRRLVPKAPQDRARMVQIMRVMDHYAYPMLVWGIYVEEAKGDRAGELEVEEIAPALHCLRVLDSLADDRFLVGDSATLADLWAYPMLTYLRMAPTGRSLLADFPKLDAWLARMDERPSALASRFPLEAGAGDPGPSE